MRLAVARGFSHIECFGHGAGEKTGLRCIGKTMNFVHKFSHSWLCPYEKSTNFCTVCAHSGPDSCVANVVWQMLVWRGHSCPRRFCLVGYPRITSGQFWKTSRAGVPAPDKAENTKQAENTKSASPGRGRALEECLFSTLKFSIRCQGGQN